MATRDTVIVEFVVQVYADGRVEWDGADEFLSWILHRKPSGGFMADADRIAGFGIRRAVRGWPNSAKKNRTKSAQPARQ